ncbi:hypothetical protein EaACW_0253 [Erwinia amylovora ACW56400]|uniref:Uncharacterized protein n=1 Tax=Erwinia amylovora NBRC 12687 = CFBP 1232 TaxID=1219359 RepID=A0A831A1B1_ERWAM|nr:hypothetical protein EaACW_0253 [Erwinia amylovora ACW56400]CCO77097.1 hypothetical protein BN432_0261 [Erwinia amylovora Ea356]CCO80879.1 hypothetical protein BN433_0268 [Erwinia amylovora Ea266]CCO92228.1 hypothetical protein BN437_0260 [Erwinia amylovora NBRC 12687 = CFBP 1232]CCO97582.1 hypothetical protein BN438_0262 [Erwinia amylovora UPN527]
MDKAEMKYFLLLIIFSRFIYCYRSQKKEINNSQ